ncbi:MAG: CorA family divalent cation transporter [Planctomycetota bacterium]|jgi:hypothetical protein
MADHSTLPPSWQVPEEFRDRLGRQAGRQRAMHCEGHLLLVLHRPPAAGDVTRQGRFFWRQPDGSWASSDLGGGARALSRHLDEFTEVLEEYDRQEEGAATAEDYFAVLEPLAPVHRSARHLYQTLQEARKMVSQDRDLINFRDRAYEIERTAELLQRETQNSLDFIMARRAEEQAANSNRMARSAHRLNVLAAFFFPIATLSTIFGVNLLHGWEETMAPIPFLAMLTFGLALGFILKSFVTEHSPKPVEQRVPTDAPRAASPRTADRMEERPSHSNRRSTRR